MKVVLIVLILLASFVSFGHEVGETNCEHRYRPYLERLITLDAKKVVKKEVEATIEVVSTRRRWFSITEKGRLDVEGKRVETKIRQKGMATMVGLRCDRCGHVKWYMLKDAEQYLRDLAGAEVCKMIDQAGISIFDLPEHDPDYQFVVMRPEKQCEGYHNFITTGDAQTIILAEGYFDVKKSGSSLSQIIAATKLPAHLKPSEIFYLELPIGQCQDCGLISTGRISDAQLRALLFRDPLFIRLYFLIKTSSLSVIWS